MECKQERETGSYAEEKRGDDIEGAEEADGEGSG